MKGFVNSFKSRKVTLTYVSVALCLLSAWWFVEGLMDLSEFMFYVPDHSQVDQGQLASILFQYNDSITDIFGKLLLGLTGIVTAFLTNNVWQKKVESNSIGVSVDINQDHEDEDDPEVMPNVPGL